MIQKKPIQSIVERYIQLEVVKYVDKIIPYATESDLIEIFTSFHIDVRIIGQDYVGKDFTAKDVCADRGIEIIYNKREHDYSTTQLRARVREGEIKKEKHINSLTK